MLSAFMFLISRENLGKKKEIYIFPVQHSEITFSDAVLISEVKIRTHVFEEAICPVTNEALNYFLEKRIPIYPSKAVNAGGVSVSYLEMCQNIEGKRWQPEVIDNKLKEIMKNIFSEIQKVRTTFHLENMVDAANVYGLLRLVTATSDKLYKKEE